MEGLHKFHLAKGTKNPQKGISWTQRKNLFTGKPKQNYGIRTGAINNITMVDLDTYKPAWQDRETHSFFDTFGDDYVERFDTWTQTTPSGGVHLVFQYDADVEQTQNSATEIDIRNDGGYMVGPYSKIFATGGVYKPVRDVPFKPFPPELKEWLRSKGFTITDEKSSKAKAKAKAKASKKTDSDIIINNDTWSAEMTPEMWRTALYEVPLENLANLNEWMVFTAACKTLRLKALWDEISKLAKGYDAERNETFWRNSGTGTGFVNSTLKMIEDKTQSSMFMSYSIFKNITPSIRDPDVLLEDRQYLSKTLDKSFFDDCLTADEDFADIVVKSDTGTGKTTAFKQFAANPVTTINGRTQTTRFISITSRISLANEQYRVFGEYGIRCSLYSDIEGQAESGHNIVTTIDSLLRLVHFDWKDYIVYIDEYGSVVDYLMTCPNLKHRRTLIFKLLIHILKEARWVVMTDADVKDYHFKLLQRPFKYFVNPHKHNGADGGVPATEIFSVEKVVAKISTYDKYLICCDSRMNVDAIHSMLTTAEKPVLKVTSNDKMTDDFNLDDHDRVIYSPSITQGLDSSIRRPVFCVYKEHTIDPPAMIQQIARCRDIEHLYYVFLNKQIKSARYDTVEDCADHHQQLNEIAYASYNLTFDATETTRLYMDILNVILYNQDCFATNKFGHFLSMLRIRGFNVTEDTKPTFGKLELEVRGKLLEEMTIENFDPTTAMVKEKNERVFHIKNPQDIVEFAEVFVKTATERDHFAISQFFFQEEEHVAKKLKFGNDFNAQKMKTIAARVLWLKNFKKDVQFDSAADNLSIDRVFTNEHFEDSREECGKAYYTVFKKLFEYRGKTINMASHKGVNDILKKCYRQLFGNLVVTVKSNGKSCIKIDEKLLDWHKRLYVHRAKERKKEEKELEFLTDTESEEEEQERLKPTNEEMELFYSYRPYRLPLPYDFEPHDPSDYYHLDKLEPDVDYSEPGRDYHNEEDVAEMNYREELFEKVMKYEQSVNSVKKVKAKGELTKRGKRKQEKKKIKAANHQAYLDAKKERESRKATRDV